MYHITMLYTLNLCNVIRQSYLSKAGGKGCRFLIPNWDLFSEKGNNYFPSQDLPCRPTAFPSARSWVQSQPGDTLLQAAGAEACPVRLGPQQQYPAPCSQHLLDRERENSVEVKMLFERAQVSFILLWVSLLLIHTLFPFVHVFNHGLYFLSHFISQE